MKKNKQKDEIRKIYPVSIFNKENRILDIFIDFLNKPLVNILNVNIGLLSSLLFSDKN